MLLRVLYFASLVDRVAAPAEELEVDPELDVEGLWKLLEQRHPGLEQVKVRPLVACDLVYADWKQPLRGVREVAFLPPVSGG